ncbi:hypothetical protein TWF506_011410 [Arthrobotrys conoides]|uniref:Uncharacterized protein n=1 Tax=Arthrobotrys conoides TaxID=74498 RepID=A0AAN8NAJ3_9PEZI
MPAKRTPARAREAPGPLHRAPYRRSPPPRQTTVTTITVTAPRTPTSGGSDAPSEGSASQVAAGMPFDIRMFLRTRRIAAGGSNPSSPFLLGEPRETASPRPRSPLQRRRHGSEPLLELPVPLKKVSRCGVKKATKGSSRQSGPRPNSTSSQRKLTTESGAKRRGRPTEAEAVRLLDTAGSARTGRSVRSGQRRSGVGSQGQLMTPPGAQTAFVVGELTENGNGDEANRPTRRSVRRGVRQTGGIISEQPLDAPIDVSASEGVRTTVRRRRAVTTNTRAPVAVLSGQRLGADGRVAPVRGEPVPAVQEQGPRDNRDGQRRQRVPSASRSQGGLQPPRQLTREETLGASSRLLTMTDDAAEERYLRGVLELRRRVEETFVPEGQQARVPAPQAQAPRRVGLSEIPMNVLNNGPVRVRGREVRQGVVRIRRRPRQRPGARTYEDNLRAALGLR